MAEHAGTGLSGAKSSQRGRVAAALALAICLFFGSTATATAESPIEPPPPPTPEPGNPFDPFLTVSQTGLRKHDRRLDGQQIGAGRDLAISLNPNGAWVTRVEFSINGMPFPKADTWAPYDLLGSTSDGQAITLPSDWFPPGTHVVEARLVNWFGSRTVEATFERLPALTPPPAGAKYDFSRVDALVDEMFAVGELNGVGLVIVDDADGIVHESYRGELGPDRISLIASSSKILSAGVLMRLHDQGLLDVNAPISDVAEWGDSNPYVITPAQLLSNSSGLPGLFGSGSYPCLVNLFTSLAECAEAAFTTWVDDPFQVAPDTDPQYGGVQWHVAGGVAEVASGKTWAQLIEETYVQPCGTDSLGFSNLMQPQLFTEGLPYPRAFHGDPSRLIATGNPNIEGGAYISARDYAEILLMHLRDGRCGDQQVLSPESVTAMQSDRIGSVFDGKLDGLGYGLGFYVNPATRIITDPGAFGALAWLNPDKGYGAYLVLEDTLFIRREYAQPLQSAVALAFENGRP